MKSIFIIIVVFLVKVANCQDGFIKGQPALAYWELGDNQDVVVVLHGGPGASHSYLRPEFDALSDVARVIYYDQRSCGKSEKSARNYWQDYMEDLRRVIHSVSNKDFFSSFFMGMLYRFTLFVSLSTRFKRYNFVRNS
jgi:predicted alpha/beta-fold hydrolase